MREAIFILVVVAVLLGLTAIRYRKTIAGMIGLAKMLKDAKDSASSKNTISGEKASVQLVNCVICGVWLPQDKAIKRREGFFYCSDACAKTVAVANS